MHVSLEGLGLHSALIVGFEASRQICSFEKMSGTGTSTSLPFPFSHLVTQANVSYYTVPLAWVFSFSPHIYAVGRYDFLYRRSGTGTGSGSDSGSGGAKFNTTSPRTFLSTLQSNPHLPQETKDRLFRAEAASLNGLENLGWFAAGVVAANAAGVDVAWVNALSLWYLLNRVGFNLLYIHGVKGRVRGLWFYGGVAAIIAMFVKAGNAARRVNM